MAKLVNNCEAIFSINIEPTDNTQLIEQLDARVRDATSLSKIAKNESIKQMRDAEVKEASDIINRMINNNEVVSYLTIYICVSAQEEKELNNKCKEIEREVQKLKLKTRVITNYLLTSGFKAVAPFFTIQANLTEYFKRNILTSSFTGGFLFNTNTFIDSGGYYFGINQNGGIIIFNIWHKDSDRTNSNMVVTGSSGSGKSLSIKHLIYNELPQSKILVIDPEDEYTYLCKNLNGKIINCGGSNTSQVLNPLQIRANKDIEEDLNAVALHFQFLHTFFEILFPSLTDMEFSALDLVLEELYEKFNITKDTDIYKLENTDFPILEDLYYFLENKNKNENKVEYEKLLSLLRPISIGGASSIWNGYTDITIDTKLTVFNTKNMQEFQIQYKRAQYYNIMSYSWEIISKNKEEKDLLIADECHVLVDPNIPQTLEFVRNISKRARKYNSSIIVITQSIEDFLNEKIRFYGQSLLANSTYKMFFKADGQDLKDIVKTFGLTKKEEQLIYNAKQGECLLSAGTRKIFATLKIPLQELHIIDEHLKNGDAV
ncbi:MAG: ATP-binding protein [Clostridia bacterium]|nr:ATP-binding protein [Clostridia bacterium]